MKINKRLVLLEYEMPSAGAPRGLFKGEINQAFQEFQDKVNSAASMIPKSLGNPDAMGKASRTAIAIEIAYLRACISKKIDVRQGTPMRKALDDFTFGTLDENIVKLVSDLAAMARNK